MGWAFGVHQPVASSPAFQFYPDDFLGSSKVAVMSAEEVGIYLLLLCYDWNETGIEWAPEDLARYCRTTEERFMTAWEKRLKRCFVERDGRWWNPRLEREREKQSAWKKKCAAGAAVTNAKRWGQGSDATANANGSLDGRIPFPSPFPAQATTGFRKRKGTANDDQPIRPHAPAVLDAPPWCEECGPGELQGVAGQKRPQRFHLAHCSRRTDA